MSSDQPKAICSLDELDFEFVNEPQTVATVPVDKPTIKPNIVESGVAKPKPVTPRVATSAKPATALRPAAVSTESQHEVSSPQETTRLRVRHAGKTTLLLSLLGLTIAGIAWFLVDRYRDISNGEIYRRTEMILTRHIDLRQGGNDPVQRKRLIQDAESFRDEVVPILSRSTSQIRDHRQRLLVAIRDNLLPMVRSSQSEESEHERTFVREFGKAKELLRDPNEYWHREPADGEPIKQSRK